MTDWINQIKESWFELGYQYDRYLEAKLRFPAHQLAIQEGRESPYTHPEKYNSDWEPI